MPDHLIKMTEISPCWQVQSLIGASNALAFDITAACSGFVVGLVTAAQFVKTGTFSNVLIIGADALSRYTDWRDRGKLSAIAHSSRGQEMLTTVAWML